MKGVGLDEDFRLAVKALNKAERGLIGAAMADIQKAFGNPHIHSGIGVRKLRRRLYEARLDLGQRLLFEERDDYLFFFNLGDHNEVQKYLKSL